MYLIYLMTKLLVITSLIPFGITINTHFTFFLYTIKFTLYIYVTYNMASLKELYLFNYLDTDGVKELDHMWLYSFVRRLLTFRYKDSMLTFSFYYHYIHYLTQTFIYISLASIIKQTHTLLLRLLSFYVVRSFLLAVYMALRFLYIFKLLPIL